MAVLTVLMGQNSELLIIQIVAIVAIVLATFLLLLSVVALTQEE